MPVNFVSSFFWRDITSIKDGEPTGKMEHEPVLYRYKSLGFEVKVLLKWNRTLD